MPFDLPVPTGAQATDESSLRRHFGERDDLLPLWIAEPYVPLAPAVVEAVTNRAAIGWYGYEGRPDIDGAFRDWMRRRHGWSLDGLETIVSPSLGTSIGVLIDLHSEPGDGVILQSPVFTDFKPLVVSAERIVAKAPLSLVDDRYEMDFAALERAAVDASMLILCNPHNPVGRAWGPDDLLRVAEICAEHDVFVVADEIHADLALPGHRFTPFAEVVGDTGVAWAALHGPIKTFGLAGLADTFIVTSHEATARAFGARSSQLHLTRNNVVGLAATYAAYTNAEGWVDELLEAVAGNVRLLVEGLPDPIRLIEPDATYLAWLDLRGLGLEVPELAGWLADEAGLALSPGHWFGREGAGFARMSIGVGRSVVEEAIGRLAVALG